MKQRWERAVLYARAYELRPVLALAPLVLLVCTAFGPNFLLTFEALSVGLYLSVFARPFFFLAWLLHRLGVQSKDAQ